jgi:hypothetical protein
MQAYVASGALLARLELGHRHRVHKVERQLLTRVGAAAST